jgi:branched-chain amino acid transport system substrate-binding protein
VSCSTDLTPESSIDCANQLVEADVAVAFTAIDLASDAALPVYQEAGIPYVTTNSWGSVQSNAEGSHILHLPGQGYAVGAGALAQQLGLTKIAQPYEVSPSAEDLALVQVPPIADQMGVEIQPIAVDGAAPDWTAAVATAQSSGAEMIWAQLSEPGCTAMVAAARAANFDGPVVAGECSAFIAELGDDAVGTYTLQNTLQPTTRASAPAEIAERLDEYAQLMDAAGQSKYTEGYATWPYGGLMEFRSILESIDGEVNAESVEAALDRDTEVPGWFGESINCGAPPWPESSANCSAAVSVYQVAEAEDGSLVRNQVIDFFDTYDRAQQ